MAEDTVKHVLGLRWMLHGCEQLNMGSNKGYENKTVTDGLNPRRQDGAEWNSAAASNQMERGELKLKRIKFWRIYFR
jgi:hypothetical protein